MTAKQRLEIYLALAHHAGVPPHIADAVLIVGTTLYGPKAEFDQDEFNRMMRGGDDDQD